MDLWRNIAWGKLLRDLWCEFRDDHVPNGAAALAFYMVLALFPAAIFGLSLLPYLPIPNLYEAVMELARQALPVSAVNLVEGTIHGVLTERNGGLLSFGFLFALWSASNGLYALMQQLNLVYDVHERRPFWRARGIAVLLTLSFFVLVVGAFGLVIFGGVLESFFGERLGWSQVLLTTFAVLRWIIIFAAIQLALSVVYYIGPNVKQSFTFLAPGTTFATVGLSVVSFGFKVYVSNFASYDAVYGGLGAVIVLLMWLFLTGLVILVGGEINELIERQRGIIREPLERGEEDEPRPHAGFAHGAARG